MQALDKISIRLFIAFSALMLLTGFYGLYTGKYWMMAVTPTILFMYLTAIDFKFVYFLMISTIPFAVETELSGGLSTDLPTEPLIAGLMLVGIFYFLGKVKDADTSFIKHPLATLVILHFAWILISSIFSSEPLVSVKFSLAKAWYLVTFFFLTGTLIKTVKDFKIFFWVFFIPLLLVVFYTIARQYATGFSFAKVNHTMDPFFRNHVNYAVTVAITLPFIFLAQSWYKHRPFIRLLMWGCIAVFLFAVIFSYTRATWLALAGALVFRFLMKAKLVMPVLITMFVIMITGIFFLARDNKYLHYAPDYKHTIYHEEFGAHLASTTKLEDISSAERVYRWVAAFNMWERKPIVGFGPGNFYNFYKGYTVSKFKTYVSRNEEKSTVHDYFLLVLVEEGMTGLLIFIALTLGIFYYGQRIYHETKEKGEKAIMMAVNLAIAVMYINLMVNDLIESVKVGSLFFILIALLINQDLKNKKLLKTPENIALVN